MALAIMWYAVHPIRLWGGSGGALVLIGPLKGLYFVGVAGQNDRPDPPKAGQGVLRTISGPCHNCPTQTTP